METAKLKKFAQFARRNLMEQVSAKLKLVLAENSAARREQPKAVAQIEKEIFGVSGKHTESCPLIPDPCPLVERVAYIWFNRFCALRFMDVNRYTRIGVVSPTEGQFQPEILAEAKMGHIDEEMASDKIRQQIFALLDGKAPSRDPQGEAYRLLVVAACNFWNAAMPFLFQRIDDYTELLMPDDLLSGNSILAYTREAMTLDACADVEVIGWLYQFYISEKKDEVFDGLKKNKKITPENIPAATQLFTPHWIVRYLVENSLGRLWLLNRPGSKLVEQMDYYIKPEQAETDFLRIAKPEEIKICDPACGSGHMLTYAFDLLYAIYEEEGYEPAEIPEKILTHNLYGIEIDERAGELAAFALTMKARAKQRRFFNKGIKPNICVLENVRFDEGELGAGAVISDQLSAVSKETRSVFLHDMKAFEEADNFGSLIRPTMTTEQIAEVKRVITDYCKLNTDLFESATLKKMLQALRQADYLSPKYHVVIANPPYMGNRSLNGRMQVFAKDNFANTKSDLFAMFIERNLDLVQAHGSVAMITMQSWMFLSTFEKLHAHILDDNTILSMAHLGSRAFDSIGGEVVSTTAFVIKYSRQKDYHGAYLRLTEGGNEAEKEANLKESRSKPYLASSAEFEKVPGAPIAYWISSTDRETFNKFNKISTISTSAVGQNTGDNDRFLKYWYEISQFRIGRNCDSREATFDDKLKWYPYNKGGGYRKWYGNFEYVINWQNDAQEIKDYAVIRNDGKHWSRYIQNLEWLFHEGITWSDVTSGRLAGRYLPKNFISDVSGHCAFFETVSPLVGLSILNSKFVFEMSRVLNPTIHFQAGNYRDIPYSGKINSSHTVETVQRLVDIGKTDWNSFETSWDFTSLPLLNPDYRQPTLKATYQKLRAHWREMTLEMQRLEEENNRIFIDAYGLQDELTPEVPLNEITLTCNPHYRYGGDKSDEELEALLLADTLRELVLYAVGYMFGRYALDKPGLILANQGETLADFVRKVISDQLSVASVDEISFMPDEDNVIPMLEGDWFTDDISARFRQFIKVAFGAEHYEENLRFVEKSLGKDLQKYFLKDFYTDHVKRYKKRPIYWLFSSPKGSFNALIYLHRYRPDTVSVVLNDYLREFRTKLTAHKNHLEAVSISASASQGEKTKALKEIENLKKIIAELEEYEREVLYPLATEQVAIDLDDGVKINYPKFGAALKKIPGLDAKED